MADQQLYPDAAQRIMAVIKNVCGVSAFTYFLGLPDNLVIPKAAFPVVIVDKVTGTYKVGPTDADDITEVVYVRLMLDIDTGLGSPDSDNTVKRQLQTLVEGRNPTTGYLLPNTLMFALRTNLTLNSASVPGINTINNEINISYNEGHYKDMPETREAILEITIYERQRIPNRDGAAN